MTNEEKITLGKILEKIKSVCDIKTSFHSENAQDAETIHKLVEAYCLLKIMGDK